MFKMYSSPPPPKKNVFFLNFYMQNCDATISNNRDCIDNKITTIRY